MAVDNEFIFGGEVYKGDTFEQVCDLWRSTGLWLAIKGQVTFLLNSMQGGKIIPSSDNLLLTTPPLKVPTESGYCMSFNADGNWVQRMAGDF